MSRFKFLSQKAGKQGRGAILTSNYMVGAFLPLHIVEYIELYCVANEITKSSLIRSIITNWFKPTIATKPSPELISIIASKANMEWQVEKANLITINKTETEISEKFQSFKSSLKLELERKKLKYSDVDSVLSLIMK